MNKQEIELRLKIIDNFLIYCQERYYVYDDPIISDGSYDNILLEAKELNEINFTFRCENYVGSSFLESYEKLYHKI